MRSTMLVCTLALVLGACTQNQSIGSTTTSNDPDRAVTTIDAEGLIAPCLVDPARFAEDGAIVVEDGVGDAGTIGAIGWNAFSGCERVTITFLTESGAPASAVGTSVATFLPEIGVIRIEYAENVTATGPVDVRVDAPLLLAAYTVRTREGRLAADLHLSGHTQVAFHADTSTSPAKSVVDIRASSDEGEIPFSPIVTDELVLLAPAGGPVEYPIRVTGYTLDPSGEITIRHTVGGEVVEERHTVAAGQGDTWGEFSIVIDDGPAGIGELFVGVVGQDAEDGVTVELQVG